MLCYHLPADQVRFNKLWAHKAWTLSEPEADMSQNDERDFLTAVINQARILLVVTDSEGRIVRFNTACEVALGFAADEVIGRRLWDLLASADESSMIQRAYTALHSAAGFPSGFVDHWLVKNGGERVLSWRTSTLVDSHGATFVVLTGTDVTQKEWVERTMASSAIPPQMLLDQIPAVIWAVDRALMITFSMGSGLHGMGFKSGQLEGLPLSEFLHTDDPNEQSFVDHRAALAGETVKRQSKWLGRTLESTMQPLRDEHGEIRGVIGIAVDITEQKKIEEDLRHERAEAEYLSRLKDEFLITLSHELRTPLMPILGFTELLQAQAAASEETVHALGIIERNAKAEIKLIDDLLDTSRVISGKLLMDVRPLQLTDVVESAMEVVHLAAEARQIKMSLAVESRPPGIVGDAQRLQQAVWNLLVNAVKFTPIGGRIHIQVSCTDHDAVVSVRDTGIGISEAFLPFVFDRFRQADSTTTREYGGLGIGLALVRHIAEAHGGVVSAASDGKGRGATFSLSLPLGALASQTPPPTTPAVPTNHGVDSPPRLYNLKILAVDDLADDCELISVVLRRHGADVRTATTVEEALAIMLVWPIGVLISDIGMPNEDGYDLIRKVRHHSLISVRNVPALALTAYAHQEGRDKVLDAGFQAYLPKPTESETLVAVVAGLARH